MEYYLDNYYVVKKEPGMYVLYQNQKASPRCCPFCNAENHYLRLHSNYYRKVYDYNSEQDECIMLKIRVRRFQCEKCHKTFTEDTYGIVPYARITERFRKLIMAKKNEKGISFMGISQIYNIPPAIAYNVCSGERGK